eukprot:scaffold16279_cov68-Cyclotella_meneghiniana.AAC.2
MAFERPIEADRVEDLGLFSSFIRAPVVGTIMWFLGGADAQRAEEEESKQRNNESESDESHHDEGQSFRDKELLRKEVDRAKRGGDDGIEPWPQISSGMDSDSEDANFPSYETYVTSQISTPEPSTTALDSCSLPVSRVIDELVAVMDASSLDEQGGLGMTKKRQSPRRSSSRSNLASLAAEADEEPPAKNRLTGNNNTSDITVTKKTMSWSDEKEQPLVEYFDDKKHSSRYRRGHGWRPSRSCSFDSQDTTSRRDRRGRSQIRIIKSALKRSGSYSPPMQMMISGHSESVTSTTSSQYSSTSGMKSFKSLSVVGSTDSDSVSSDSLNKSSHIPPSLKMGSGRTNGGLIIPSGGQSGAFPGYHITLGTAVHPKVESSASQDEEETKILTPNSGPSSNASPSMPYSNNTRQSSNPNHFLPHHSNGYVSPQYGFYVNITPPTPEMFYPRPPSGMSFPDAKSRNKATMQQPSHQQFANQQKPFRPSPIPEVTTISLGENKKPPLQPMIYDSPNHSIQDARKALKPAFVKKNRMGMFLSDNPHQVYPTVPFG